MKIATVLSVSALFAMFSVVACSSPTTPADSGDKSDSADSKGDEKDSKDSKSSTTSKSSTSTTPSNTTGATTTTPTNDNAAEAACTSCLAADPTMKKVMDCQASCKDDDDACFGKCASDNGCAENDANSACAKAFDTCESKCEPPPPSDSEVQACQTCLSGQNNAQVNAIESCYNSAKDQASADKCGQLEDSACDSKCQAAYKACDSKCGF